MGLLDEIGISAEDFAAIEAQKAGGTLLDSGVYEMAIDQAYIRKTDSGAKMLELKFKTENGTDFRWSTCTQSGDEKGNKATWTVREDHAESTKKRYGVGTEVNLPGVEEMKRFLDALGDNNPAVAVGEVKHGEDTIEALCFTEVQGKKIKLGINQEESLYDGNVNVRNNIDSFMTVDGKNGKGEDIEEKIKKKLARNPLKALKGTATAKTNTNQTGENLAKKGW